MPATIRPATGRDLPALLRLCRQLDPSDPVLSEAEAEADGAVLATCSPMVGANLTRAARPCAVVANVVTDPVHRRQGCREVMLMTGSRRDSTPHFYAAAGFAIAKTAFQIRRS